MLELLTSRPPCAVATVFTATKFHWDIEQLSQRTNDVLLNDRAVLNAKPEIIRTIWMALECRS
jgi:hypothetical protein